MAWCFDQDFNYPEIVFQDGNESVTFTMLRGAPAILDEIGVPTTAIVKGKEKLNVDLFIVSGRTQNVGSAAVVTENFREAIEKIEPAVHQFFPLTILGKDGQKLPSNYYILRVRQAFPVILFRQSKMAEIGYVIAGPNKGSPYYECSITGVVLSKPMIAGRNLFSSRIINGGCCFMSDALMAECEKRNIKGLFKFPALEHETPWLKEVVVPELMKWLEENPHRKAENSELFREIA